MVRGRESTPLTLGHHRLQGIWYKEDLEMELAEIFGAILIQNIAGNAFHAGCYLLNYMSNLFMLSSTIARRIRDGSLVRPLQLPLPPDPASAMELESEPEPKAKAQPKRKPRSKATAKKRVVSSSSSSSSSSSNGSSSSSRSLSD